MKQGKYDDLYLRIAREIGLMSYSKRAQVGAIIVKDDRIISMGWNGTPHGFNNICEIESDGDLKTKPEVLHAETNCISKIAKSTESSCRSTLYVTMSPCFDCSKIIIQSGIERVVYIDQYRNTSGIDLLKKAKLRIEQSSIK